jgi:hypothetical protein
VTASYIQLPADDSGKKVQSWDNLIGGNQVHTQAMTVVDSSGAEYNLADATVQSAMAADLVSIAANTGNLPADPASDSGVAASILAITQAEDDAHASADVGVMALAVRKDVSAALAGTDGDYHPLETDSRGQLHTAMPKAGTSTDVSLASSASSAQLLAANTARTGLYLTNTDANDVYVYFGTTATASKFSVRLGYLDTFVMPAPIYTGRIDAIWSADGSGSLIGTELAN